MSQLSEAVQQEKYSNLEKAGLIKTCDFTFELAWKTLKDLLQFEGFDAKTPREVIRQAFSVQYLSEDDAESLLDGLAKRNLLSHTYEEATAQEAVDLIKHQYAPVFRRVYDTLGRKLKS